VASLKEHCEDCLRELGEAFTEVHEWLDELQVDYGPMHRPFRHHTEGIERVRSRWGSRAAKAAEIHIKRDCAGAIPTPDEIRNYWGIKIEDIELGDFD